VSLRSLDRYVCKLRDEVAALEAPREAAEDIGRYAGDPVGFAGRVGLRPDAWQADLLCRADRHLILLCARQTGKSAVSAVLALHQALFHPPSLALLLSPSLRQSQELFRKVKDALAALGKDACSVAVESALRLELANRSRIVSLPGKEATIRGFSNVALLVVDEASRVADDLYHAVRPMLAVSGGRLVLLSTPFGKRGFFYHEWTEGGPAWRRVKVTAEECPRISKEWLERERATIGDWWFAQEYGCAFVETDDQVFRYNDIAEAFDANVAPLFGHHG
jgi:hypothetical protein